jgi:hypothetical protein
MRQFYPSLLYPSLPVARPLMWMAPKVVGGAVSERLDPSSARMAARQPCTVISASTAAPGVSKFVNSGGRGGFALVEAR